MQITQLRKLYSRDPVYNVQSHVVDARNDALQAFCNENVMQITRLRKLYSRDPVYNVQSHVVDARNDAFQAFCNCHAHDYASCTVEILFIMYKVMLLMPETMHFKPFATDFKVL